MQNTIKIMFLGDIVGKPGRLAVRDFISDLNDNKPDFIIANAENASHGFGLTLKNYNELLSYGIDFFTSGNHIWDKREIFNYIDEAEKIIRPINYPKGTHGKGYTIIETEKCKIGIINVLGRTFMGTVDAYFELIDNALEEIKKETNVIFMDIHAEATAEKISLAKYYAQKGISYIAGTHTHVQTADEQIFDNRCAYISDAGFCGASNGVIGMDYEISLRRMLSEIPERLEVADSDKLQINGAVAVIDCYTGYAHSIERINEVIYNKENTDMKG